MANASSKGRLFLAAIVTLVIGCATQSPKLYWHTSSDQSAATASITGLTDLDKILAANPLGPNENIRVFNLGRAAESSTHIVQVRHAEQLHIHRDHDLTVIVQRGHGTLRVGGVSFDVRQGDTAFIPRGVPHAFKNLASSPAVALVVFSPPFDGKDNITVNVDK